MCIIISRLISRRTHSLVKCFKVSRSLHNVVYLKKLQAYYRGLIQFWKLLATVEM